jgi:hypothetical protein
MTQVRNAMDICMFTPAERKELETLVATYETARAQLETYFENRLEVWGNEIVADDIDARSDFMIDQVVYRFDQVGEWLKKLLLAKILVSEIDEVIIIDDEV